MKKRVVRFPSTKREKENILMLITSFQAYDLLVLQFWHCAMRCLMYNFPCVAFNESSFLKNSCDVIDSKKDMKVQLFFNVLILCHKKGMGHISMKPVHIL